MYGMLSIKQDRHVGLLHIHTHHTRTWTHDMSHTATHCNTLQHTATVVWLQQSNHDTSHVHRRDITWHVTHCNTLQHPATHCNSSMTSAIQSRHISCPYARCHMTCHTLQHTATHCMSHKWTSPVTHTIDFTQLSHDAPNTISSGEWRYVDGAHAIASALQLWGGFDWKAP